MKNPESRSQSEFRTEIRVRIGAIKTALVGVASTDESLTTHPETSGGGLMPHYRIQSGSTQPREPEISGLDDYGLDPYEFRIYSRLARQTQHGLTPETPKALAANCGIGLPKTKQVLGHLEQLGLIKQVSLTPQAIKQILSNKLPQSFQGTRQFCERCEWCQGTTIALHEHHYPVQRKDGGRNVVSICPNCHAEFHALTDAPIYRALVYFPWEEVGQNLDRQEQGGES